MIDDRDNDKNNWLENMIIAEFQVRRVGAKPSDVCDDVFDGVDNDFDDGIMNS